MTPKVLTVPQVAAVNSYDESRKLLRELTGNLINWSIDLETGKTKATVAHGLRTAAARLAAHLEAGQ